jgi:hypothetical protein
MDGNRYLPCVPLYYGDTRVTVSHWKAGVPFPLERIFDCILNKGRLLPYKTTRHRFDPALPRTDFALCVLRGVALQR